MNLLLLAGYTKKTLFEAAQSVAAAHNLTVAMAHERVPSASSHFDCLTRFDHVFDLKKESDRAALQAHNVAAITTTQERDMDTYISLLKLCGHATAEEADLYMALSNKRTFRTALGSTHPDLVPKLVVLKDDGLEEAADSISYPAVVKPTGLSGSAFVQVAQNKEELLAHYKNMRTEIDERSEEVYNRKSEIIAEEYIDGLHYYTNAYINTQMEPTFCPTVRVVPGFELGIKDGYSAFQYVTDELTQNEQHELERACQKIITHFKLKSTSAHFDMVKTKSGWMCLEVGLRTGGNRHEMFEKSHGMNHHKNDIENRLGTRITIPSQIGTVCVMQKASEKTGLLKSIAYTRSVTEAGTPKIEEMKLSSRIDEEVKPVAEGGGTLTRHLVYGKRDGLDSYQEAQKLFAAIEITVEAT